jgi:hypothetical protein
VLAQDRDRFAREPAYHYLLRQEFEEHRTKIRALNDRGDESPEGGSRMASSTSSPSSSGRRPQRGRAEASCVRHARERSSAATRRGTVSGTTKPGTATKWSRGTWQWSGGSSR